MERKKIDISKVYANKGQIEGLPRNPRTMRKEKFDKLMKSIRDLPEMTEARDLLVYPHDGKFVVLGGNMRLRAYRERKAGILRMQRNKWRMISRTRMLKRPSLA